MHFLPSSFFLPVPTVFACISTYYYYYFLICAIKNASDKNTPILNTSLSLFSFGTQQFYVLHEFISHVAHQ